MCTRNSTTKIFIWWDDVLRDGQTASPFAAPVPSDVVDRLLPEIQEHIWIWTRLFRTAEWPHNDATDVGATLYLNDFPLNYGGLFVYEDADNDKRRTKRAHKSA